jgi:hypothetical protein
LGPAVIALLDNVEIVESSWDAPGWDAIAWVVPRDRTVLAGAIGLSNCVFSGCVFRRVGLAVPQDGEARLRAGFE